MYVSRLVRDLLVLIFPLMDSINTNLLSTSVRDYSYFFMPKYFSGYFE